MPKERIELSIDSEILQRLRTDAIRKYGNLRSVSKLIEDTYTSRNLTVIDEEFDDSSRISSHNGTDIGGLNPDFVYSRLRNLSLHLSELKVPDKKVGVLDIGSIKYEIDFIDRLDNAIMKGMCNGSLDRYRWCPSCDGYMKNADGSYSHFDDMVYEDGKACEVRPIAD